MELSWYSAGLTCRKPWVWSSVQRKTGYACIRALGCRGRRTSSSRSSATPCRYIRRKGRTGEKEGERREGVDEAKMNQDIEESFPVGRDEDQGDMG